MINFTAVKNIISVAAFSGLLAGLLLTGIQQIEVLPTLLEAEHYEQAATTAAHSDGLAESAHAHTQEKDEWQPENGMERTVWTGIANISLAFSFALLLGVAMHLHGRSNNWRSGLLWGLAGYTVFFVAPSLGLPPEVPGTEAAALHDRQMWWLMTVLATTGGLSVLFFVNHWSLKLLGILFLVLPHLSGAPQPQAHGSAVPLPLIHSFIFATAIANAIFWLCLGSLQGFLTKN